MFRAACIEMNGKADLGENLELITSLLKQANKMNVDLACLPENAFLMPKKSHELIDAADGISQAVEVIRDLAASLEIDVIIGSIPVKSHKKDKVFNRSIYIDHKANILGYYNKMHLFDANLSATEVYKESNYTMAGNKLELVATRFGSLGLSVCYDIRFPYMFRKYAQNGAYFLSIPAAFAETTGKMHWHVLARARAIENRCFVFAPAQFGVHASGRRTYGHSLIVDPNGAVLAEGDATSNQVIYADIEVNWLIDIRSKVNNLAEDLIK